LETLGRELTWVGRLTLPGVLQRKKDRVTLESIHIGYPAYLGNPVCLVNMTKKKRGNV